MCECRAQNAEAVREHFAKKLAGKADVDDRATQENSGARKQGNALVMVGLDEYRLRTYPKRKDGTRTGREKVESMPIIHSYCPHCGEKYPTD